MSTQTGNHVADKDLVTHVLRGDQAAFGTIIKNTEGLVASIVCKMIPDTEARKDLAQDIYLKAFHKLAGFKFQCKLSTWIAQIAYNTCFSWLEKKKLVLPGSLEEGGDSNEAVLEQMSSKLNDRLQHSAELLVFEKQRSVIINAAVERLNPVFRTLITLYHQQELSYTAIAEIMDLPEGTVKSYLFRARKALKEDLLVYYKKEEL